MRKYLPFPGHTGIDSAMYHSESLPNPNVVRIEVLSPSARAAYLNNGVYAALNTFQQTLMERFLGDADSIKPFYGFFDPSNEGVGFDMSAEWRPNSDHGFNEMTTLLKDTVGRVPVVGKLVKGAADLATSMKKAAEGLINKAGIDTKSTGACTMKDFKKADFKFDKTIVCRWYMPEQENMARLSISRLLKLAYVRTLDADGKDFVGEITKAVSGMFDHVSNSGIVESVTSTMDGVKNTVKAAAPWAFDSGSDDTGSEVSLIEKTAGVIQYGGEWAYDQLNSLSNRDIADLSKDVIKQVANGGIDAALKINRFLGGNLTINPFPVRITIGHILDIEPAVITSVSISSSKEQFITEDGTHVPLFITAKIGISMWMIPDPRKGFIRWLGDDVFTGGRMPGSSGTGNAGTGSGASSYITTKTSSIR